MKNVIVFFLLLLSVSISSQESYSMSNTVGFNCSIIPKPTPLVLFINEKIKNEKYSLITKMLYSENNAKKYLAVITLERLDKLKYYQLSFRDKNEISKIKKSNGLIYTCSGCFLGEAIELRVLFTSKKYKDFSKYWLERVIK